LFELRSFCRWQETSDYWLDWPVEFKLSSNARYRYGCLDMKYLIGLMVLILLILHQDYWNWYNGELVFGFLPYSIAYHCGISLAAAALWLVAVKFCWPSNLHVAQQEDAEQGGLS
jgi:hypothetical protein